jgi:hypothetical protein
VQYHTGNKKTRQLLNMLNHMHAPAREIFYVKLIFAVGTAAQTVANITIIVIAAVMRNPILIVTCRRCAIPADK